MSSIGLKSLTIPDKHSALKSVYSGTVVDNNDPKQLSRVRVTIDNVFDGVDKNSLPWCIPFMDALIGNTSTAGRFGVPILGSVLTIIFLGEDASFPVYIGAPVTTNTNRSEFLTNYPNRYGFKDETGNILIIDKTANTLSFTHKTGTLFSIDATGIATLNSVKDIDLITQNSGNMNLTVTGNFTANVTGNVSWTIGGTLGETVTGAVTKNYQNTLGETVTGAVTKTYQSTLTENITGAAAMTSSSTFGIGGTTITLTAPTTNVTGVLNVTGAVSAASISTTGGGAIITTGPMTTGTLTATSITTGSLTASGAVSAGSMTSGGSSVVTTTSGTATNASSLGGLPAADYALLSGAVFTGNVTAPDFVGKLAVYAGNECVIHDGIASGATAYINYRGSSGSGISEYRLCTGLSNGSCAPLILSEASFLGTSSTCSIYNASNTGALRIDGSFGYVQVGPQNTGFCHFFTDRPTYYFDHLVQANGGFQVYSDPRLKDNLKPIDFNTINFDTITAYDYVWNKKVDNKYLEGKKAKGILATDIYKVLPEIVSLDEEGNPTTVDYAVLGTLWSARNHQEIKRLKERIQQLEDFIGSKQWE